MCFCNIFATWNIKYFTKWIAYTKGLSTQLWPYMYWSNWPVSPLCHSLISAKRIPFHESAGNRSPNTFLTNFFNSQKLNFKLFFTIIHKECYFWTKKASFWKFCAQPPPVKLLKLKLKRIFLLIHLVWAEKLSWMCVCVRLSRNVLNCSIAIQR